MTLAFRVLDYRDLITEEMAYFILMKSSSQLGTIYAIPVGSGAVRSYRKELTFMEEEVFPELGEMGVNLIEVQSVVFDGDTMIVRLMREEDLKRFYRDFFILGEKFNYTYISSIIHNPPVIFSFSGPHGTTRKFAESLKEEGYKVIEGEL
ncbi:MAG: hypothetical protein ACE5HW_01405 [Candidatus Methanofastidiosia archaeon]